MFPIFNQPNDDLQNIDFVENFSAQGKSSEANQVEFVRILPNIEPQQFDFGPGDNYFVVLPSCADYRSYFPNNRHSYQIGKPYNQLRLMKISDSYMRTYRAPQANPLTEKFWMLFNIFKQNNMIDEFKKISANFQAGGDPRRVLNIMVVKAVKGQLLISPIKMFRVPDERPNRKTRQGQLPALYTQISHALAQAYKQLQHPEIFEKAKSLNPKLPRENPYPFFPEHCAILKLTISFRGTIPQYNALSPVISGDGVPHLLDVSSFLNDESLLNAAAEWAAGYDALPEIHEILSVVTNEFACKILNIECKKVASFNPHQDEPRPEFVPTAPMTPSMIARSDRPSQITSDSTSFLNSQAALPTAGSLQSSAFEQQIFQQKPVQPVVGQQPVVPQPIAAQPTAPNPIPVPNSPDLVVTPPIPAVPSSVSNASALFMQKLQAELAKSEKKS